MRKKTGRHIRPALRHTEERTLRVARRRPSARGPVMLRGAPVLSSALEELHAYLQRKGMTAAELVGVAADRRKTFADMPLRTNNWKKYIADAEEGFRET